MSTSLDEPPLAQALMFTTFAHLAVEVLLQKTTASQLGLGGTSLMVQWLRLCAPNTGALGLIPGQGARSHMPQLRPTIGDKLCCGLILSKSQWLHTAGMGPAEVRAAVLQAITQ